LKFLSIENLRRRLLKNSPNSTELPTLVNQWFQSTQGAAVLKSERKIVNALIEMLFGYHILQVGCSDEISLISDSPVGHKVIFSSQFRAGASGAVANNEELPLESDSIDVILIHHALDFTENSHRLLREVTRVLRPGGRLIIVGFNLWSYWGLWKLFKSRANVPWCGRFISKGRLSDWLQLLDLQIESTSYGLHFMPFKFTKLLESSDKVEEFGNRIKSPLGGAYFMSCIKQALPLTPIVPRWKPIRAHGNVIPAAENIRAKVH
jgi:SAM-dependent methyltransferase